MRKSKLLTSIVISVLALGMTAPAHSVTKGAPKDQVPVFRLYNKNTGEHFYTPNARELIHLQSVGWTSEGIGWYSPTTGASVYRIYNPNAKGGDHYYTMNKAEAAHNVSLGWKWDNDSKPAFYSGGEVKNYVTYNPNAESGAHNYTTNSQEKDRLLCNGWKYGSVAWITLKAGKDQVSLNQISNRDLTTIQGLWRDGHGWTLEVVGDHFYLNGKEMNDGLKEDILSTATKKEDHIEFRLHEEVSCAAMAIIPAGVDLSYTSNRKQDRIFIGQEDNPESYFYKVGQSVQ